MCSKSDKYRKLEIIGEGTYGIVFKAQSLLNGQTVAIKQIRLEQEEDGIPSTALREVALLRELRHDNVVRLIDVVLEDRKLSLVFEYLDLDLKVLLTKCSISQSDSSLHKYFMWQMLEALRYCHGKRILHRDLKPQNILVDLKQSKVKLADFGLARAFGVPVRAYTHEVITLWYRAPEILLGTAHYATAIDIWSLGCIFAEMLTNRPLFTGETEIDQIFKIFRTLGTPSDETWPGILDLPEFNVQFPKWRPQPLEDCLQGVDIEAVDLISQMLIYEPQSRITAEDALSHPYFNDIEQAKMDVNYTQPLLEYQNDLKLE